MIWPDLVTTEYVNVEVESGSELTRGATIVDINRVTDRRPNVHVAVGIDGPGFTERLRERLHRLP